MFVGNGAFKVAEYTIGEGMVLESNQHYWKADKVGIDRINILFIDDESTAYQAYQAGEIDFLQEVPPSEIPRLIAENPEYYVYPLLGTYYYNFNMDLDMWQDIRVRKALTLSN